MKKEEKTRMKGKFLWFNLVLHYGWILGDDKNDCFVYIDEIDKVTEAEENVKCEFTPDTNERGLIAKKVIVE